jgi:hypothetical protein
MRDTNEEQRGTYDVVDMLRLLVLGDIAVGLKELLCLFERVNILDT